MRSTLANVEMEEPPSHTYRGEYIRLMEILVVALQTGLTNVATLWSGPSDGILPIL